MKILIRADASREIGGGHVMRCLTLADELARKGHACVFCVRSGSVETVPKLAQSAHELIELIDPEPDEADEIEKRIGSCDWLIIDHYQRDERFERKMRNIANHIMVIDDLADRKHECDILLDQTYGRAPEDYAGLVPDSARLLMGTSYALLRPEFARLRSKALERRKKGGPVRRILVSLGASDPHGMTAKVLNTLSQSDLDELIVDVVTGSRDPAAMGLVKITRTMPQHVNFHGFDADMAELMVEADLAIGAGGTSSWERCCLGLPTLLLITADNQKKIARELEAAKAVLLIGTARQANTNSIETKIISAINADNLLEMVSCAAMICDGDGAYRVANAINEYEKEVIL